VNANGGEPPGSPLVCGLFDIKKIAELVIFIIAIIKI